MPNHQMYIITLSFALIYGKIIISEVKESNHGYANIHSCIQIFLSQIISIYDIKTKFCITKRDFLFF